MLIYLPKFPHNFLFLIITDFQHFYTPKFRLSNIRLFGIKQFRFFHDKTPPAIFNRRRRGLDYNALILFLLNLCGIDFEFDCFFACIGSDAFKGNGCSAFFEVVAVGGNFIVCSEF